ncbi:MAG: glycerol-3-phosphate 1-O-acyltransferase PlsY [Gammaproteobacteria bacterium]|nr:glycerol-3-phosphate 1-O-acyltransferase PlsY [Gammaproteobacteria bacterium]
MTIDTAFILLAYLMGSLSTAIIYCKVAGLPDPRSQGSGNPGATNVLRFGGKKVAIIVLLGDLLKGLIPVLLAKWLGLSAAAIVLVGIAAFLGHLYPVFFRFKGGKGVATALGILLGISGWVGLLVLVTWFFVAFISRLSSLSALVAAVFSPFFVYLLMPEPEYILLAILLAILLIWRHRSNIQKIMNGTESKIGKK